MAPKKKKGEEEKPPEPETLLPAGYGINCEVFWVDYPQSLGEGEHGGTIVRPGCKGVLKSVPDMIESVNDEGEKRYDVETAAIHFDRHAEPQVVPLKSVALSPPPRAAIWNMKPTLRRKRVVVEAPFAPLNPSDARKNLREATSPIPTRRPLRTPSPEVERSRAASPFIDAMFTLEAYPCRADKVEHLLKPSLLAFLSDTEFQYSSNTLGGHAQPGLIDWQAIYPWIRDVLKNANSKARLSPELCVDVDSYAMLVKRFDKTVGAFISNCPLSENILPFAKFVVTLLYLEVQEEIRKRLEREAQIKELLEREASQDGNPRVSLLWDTEEDLELYLRLPGDFGEIKFRPQFVDEAEDVNADDEGGSIQSLETIAWPEFDPQATGKEAVSCPPVGEYQVWIRAPARRAPPTATAECHWACAVAVGGESTTFGGTWDDCVAKEVTSFWFDAPGASE